nr:hypothetical protein [uncultured Butyrivibrio sp.]
MAHKIYDEAQIMAAYTLNSWFVTFSPWFEGDNMVVSFVKKGSKGKDSFPIYVALDKFEKFLKSIENGSFKNALAEDTKSDNPEAWTYRTGNNGSKQLAIGLGKVNSKTGKRNVCVHGYDATRTKDKNADVPISYEILEDLAANYRLIVGPAPTDNIWHKMLYDAFWSAYKTKAGHYTKGAEDEETIDETPVAVQDEVPVNAPSESKDMSTFETDVTLTSYKKEGDVVSFSGTIEGQDAILRISSTELGGKDKQAWKNVSDNMSKGNADVRLKLRHVRNEEYTILAIA